MRQGHVLNANRERISAMKQIEELKYNLKQQQMTEEIRQTELYQALVKNNDLPKIFPTNTTFKIDIDLKDREPFEFPTKSLVKKKNYYNLAKDEEEDVLDNLIQETSMIPINKNYQSGESNYRKISNQRLNNIVSGLDYLSYFDNALDINKGIRLESSEQNEWNLPDDFDNLQNLNSAYVAADDRSDGIVNIMRRNRERLDMLDQLDGKDVLDSIDQMIKDREIENSYKNKKNKISNGFEENDRFNSNRKLYDEDRDIIVHRIRNPNKYKYEDD